MALDSPQNASRFPRKKALNKWSRRLHRWGAVVVALPLLVVVVSGIVLQLKKEASWIQPPTISGSGERPSLSFDDILAAARGVEEAGIASWEDVDRLDVRPTKGVVKVRGKGGVEVQVDTHTGEVLQVMRRRSDWIESLHDGSWFHDRVKLWVFLPSGILVFGLWCTGMYLWYLPIGTRRSQRRRGNGNGNGS